MLRHLRFADRPLVSRLVLLRLGGVGRLFLIGHGPPDLTSPPPDVCDLAGIELSLLHDVRTVLVEPNQVRGLAALRHLLLALVRHSLSLGVALRVLPRLGLVGRLFLGRQRVPELPGLLCYVRDLPGLEVIGLHDLRAVIIEPEYVRRLRALRTILPRLPDLLLHLWRAHQVRLIAA